MNNRRVRVSAS